MAETQPIADQVKEQVKQGTQKAVQQGQQYMGQAADLLTTQVKATLTQQKNHVPTGITDVAQLLQQNSEAFRSQGVGVYAAPYIDQAVGKLNEVGQTIRNKDIDEVIRDSEAFARVQPAVFLGIAATLGFFAARLPKSTSETGVAA